MSANSSFLPLHESLNSATHLSGDTFESAKLPRKRSDMSASSFGELFTCIGSEPLAVLRSCVDPLVYTSVTVTSAVASRGVTSPAPGTQVIDWPLPADTVA